MFDSVVDSIDFESIFSIDFESGEGKFYHKHTLKDLIQKPILRFDFSPVNVQRKQKLTIALRGRNHNITPTLDVFKFSKHPIGTVTDRHVEPIGDSFRTNDSVQSNTEPIGMCIVVL